MQYSLNYFINKYIYPSHKLAKDKSNISNVKTFQHDPKPTNYSTNPITTNSDNLLNTKSNPSYKHNIDVEKVLKDIVDDLQNQLHLGEVASYIPELLNVKKEQLGVAIATLDGKVYAAGDSNKPFSIQSISKIFSLTKAKQLLGDDLWTRVSRLPSNDPFNDIIKIDQNNGIPSNPCMNAGALVTTDVLYRASNKNSKNSVLHLVKKLSGNDNIYINTKVSASEMSCSHRNMAIANLIKSFGNLTNKPKDVVQLYTNNCAIEMTCEELAKSFLYLANNGIMPMSNSKIIDCDATKQINGIMHTCGGYGESGELSAKIGYPLKTGVGGGIVVIVPNFGVITAWHPALNEHHNTYVGSIAVERITERLHLYIQNYVQKRLNVRH
jgi:glutaminase